MTDAVTQGEVEHAIPVVECGGCGRLVAVENGTLYCRFCGYHLYPEGAVPPWAAKPVERPDVAPYWAVDETTPTSTDEG